MEEINLSVNVKGGNAKKSVGETRKELEKAAQSAKKVSGSIKKIGTEGLSVKNRLKILKNEMAEIGNIGSPRFQELAREAGKLKDQMNNANTAITSMSSDFPKLQTGIAAFNGIGSAAQFAAGAQLLLGNENKELAKAMQRAMALTTMMTSVQSLANLTSDEAILGQKLRMINSKLLTRATIQEAVATGTATKAQKVMNVVMKANPIGLIIAGIMALIGGLVLLGKNVKKVGDFFTWLGDIMVGALSGVLMFFGLTDEAIETQSMKERKAFEEKTAQQKEIAKQNTERLNAIKKEFAALEEKNKREQAAFDLEIEINDLLGKSSKALTEQKLENNLIWAQEQQRLTLEALESWTKYYEDLFAMSGKSREDFAAQLKGQGIDIDLLEKEKVRITEEANNLVRLEDAKLQSFKIKGAKEVTDANEKEAAKQLAIEKKLIADRKRAAEKAQKNWETLQKKRGDFLEKMEKKVRDSNADAFQKKLNKLQDEHDKEMELLEELIPEQNELRLQLERDYQEAREEIQAEADEADEQQRLDRIAKVDEDANKVIDTAKNVTDIVGSLNTIFHGKELKRIKEKQARGEKLTASEEKRIRKEAKLQKALAVVQIATDTARAISGAIAAGASIPFPGNIPAIIAGVAAVLSNVAAASQVLGESIDIPSSPSSAVDSAGEVGDQTPNTDPLTEGSTDLTGGPPQQVVVVESITDGINSVGVIEAQATFG